MAEERTTTQCVIPTTSIALVSHAQLAASGTVPEIPVVVKSYLRRDVAKHGLTAAVQAERAALVRLSWEQSNQVPKLLSARVTTSSLTFVMKRMPGIPSNQLPLPLPAIRVASIIRNVVSALRVVHAQDIVHGDLVMRNVLVDVTQDDAVCLIDFSASFLRNGHRRDVSRTTTPIVLPPEVVRGSLQDDHGADGVDGADAFTLTPLADVWALGILTWSLLIPSNLSYRIDQFVQGKLSLHHALPDSLRALPVFDFLKMCLQILPAHRFNTANVSWRSMVDYQRINAHPFINC